MERITLGLFYFTSYARKHVPPIYFCLFVFICSQAVAGKEFRVYSPTSIEGTRTAEKVCSIIMEGLAPPDLGPSPSEVFVVEELHQPSKGDAKLPSQVLKDVHEARLLDGQDVVPLQSENSPLNWINQMILGIRFGNIEQQVRLLPKEVPSRSKRTSQTVLEESPAHTSWIWMLDERIEIDPALINTTEQSPNAHFLPENREKKVLPSRVLKKMNSYDLRKEMLGLPHSRYGHRILENPNSDFRVQFGEKRYYLVLDPHSEERIGYLVVQDMTYRSEIHHTESLYRHHFSPGTKAAEQVKTETYRYVARFDLEGNRVEKWETPQPRPPLGNVIQEGSRVQFNRFLSDGTFLKIKDTGEITRKVPSHFQSTLKLYPREYSVDSPVVGTSPRKPADALLAKAWGSHPISSGPMITEGAMHGEITVSPNGRVVLVQGNPPYLVNTNTGKTVTTLRINEKITTASFSPDGSKLYLGHPDGWLRVVDPLSGKTTLRKHVNEKGASNPPHIRKIIELPDGSLLVGFGSNTSYDERVFLFSPRSGKMKLFVDKIDLHSIHGSTVYTYHYFFGLEAFPFKFSDGEVSWLAKLPRTTNYADGIEAIDTQLKNYTLLSPSGDHFIAYSSMSRRHGVYQYTKEGLTLLSRPNNPKAYQRSTNDLGNGASNIVSLTQKGAPILRYVNTTTSGGDRVSKPITLPIEGVTSIAFYNDVLAITHQGSLSLWQLHNGNPPRKIKSTKLPTSKPIDHLEFSQDGQTLLFSDTSHNVGAVWVD